MNVVRNALLVLAIVSASLFGQVTTETKLDNGFHIVATAQTDGTVKKELFDATGAKLEDAWGFFYDRKTTMMYDPNGKFTGFTFEPARIVMMVPDAVGNIIPRVDLISPPLAFATQETAEKLVALLKEWLPGYKFTIGYSNYQNGSWRREPQNERQIIMSLETETFEPINAGLLANTVMRYPTNSAKLFVTEELKKMRPVSK